MLQTLLRMLILKSVWTMSPEMVDLLTPSKALEEACGYDSCPRIWPGALNVHVVPHTHYEVGFQRQFHEHFSGNDRFGYSQINMKRTLDYVITDLWSHKDRKFTLSDIPYFFYWWSKRDPTVRRMVFELIRQGRLYFVGGSWGMNDEATTSYHAIIDSFTYALRKINATFLSCAQPLVAWQSDVMGHSKEFAHLTAAMGFDGLFLNPISFDDTLARMKRKAMEFLWRGSDDQGPSSDIFTHILFDGYWSPPGFCFATDCDDPEISVTDTMSHNGDERAKAFIESMMYRQAPNYNTSHIMVMMGKMLGYWDSTKWFTNIERLMISIAERSDATKTKINVFYSTPACYLKEVRNSNPDLETKQDDFFPYAYDKRTYLTGFYTSCPSMKLLAREGLVFLQMSKQMQVLARLFNNDQFFEDFMWAFGLFQDHTVITGSLADHAKAFYVNKLYIAIQKSTLLLKQAWNKIRRSPKGTLYYRCSFNISSCHIARAKSSFIMLYNPLTWHVTVPVRLPIVHPGEYEIYDPNWQKLKVSFVKLPQPVLKIPGRTYPAVYDLVFIAEKLPPLGFRSYFISRISNYLHTKVQQDRSSDAVDESTKETPRRKRTLIKNINKKKHNKKYLIRQNQPSDDDQVLLNELDDDDDEGDVQSKIFVGNMTTFGEQDENETTTSTTEPQTAKTWETDRSNKGETNNDKTRQRVEQINVDLDDDDEETITLRIRPTQTHPTPTSNLSNKQTVATETSEKSETSETTDTSETTSETTTESKSVDEINKIVEMRRRMYDADAQDTFIENEHIRINMDPGTRKITDVTLSNGVHINLDIQFYFYASDDPEKLGKKDFRTPGASTFRAADNQPFPILKYLDVKIYKKSVVQEAQFIYSDWSSLVVRLYKSSPVVEVDWVVGPVPAGDGIGREVFIRYMTDLVNEAAFYTDSNGRQTIKRIRNMRPMFDTLNNDPVAGNFYPVTSKIYIEDLTKNIRFSVFNDRAQGGSSQYDGEIDLMLTRRILTDDTGMDTFVNDTEWGEGQIVRGKHYLYISKANYNPNKIFEKKFAKEIELAPQILVSSPDPYGEKTKEDWLGHVNEKSFIKNKLPIGIHLLTLEKWNDGTLLLRLENYLEKSDIRNGAKTVFLKNLFTNIVIYKIRETTLAANNWLDTHVPLRWKRKDKFVKSFNEFYGAQKPVEFVENETPPSFEEADLYKGIVLTPQQIRTFVCWFDYVD